ncbi:MAG: AAA family ATPase, partial [Beijerinckiaceae bacterium]
MKFEKLFLEKYGHYENREIAFRPDAHLHVVLGRNEAGKSTALAAISDLLFGFDRRTGAGIFKPHYKFDSRELRIGAQLRFADGNDVAFRRRRGNKNTIVGADGEALGDDLLDPFLGGLDRATFEAEFGLTAERLRAGGDELLDAGGKLAETLAAGSAGLSALNQLKKRLQDEADGIFTPRKAAGKPFYAALDALDAARRALRDAIVTADAVAEAGKECARTEAARAALEEEHRTVSREVSKLKRIRQVRPMLARIAVFEEKLAGLGDLPPVAESATENWRKSFDAALETAEKIRLVQEKREAAANALAALSRNPALVEAGAKVADLREQLGARDKARKDIPNREAELHVEETQLDQAARDLGFDDRGKLLAAMPARPVLARVHAAVQARKSAALVRREKQENLERARQRQADLQRKDEAQGYLADPAPFAAELERFAEMPREAADLRRKSAELEEYIRDLEVRAARLQPPAPPLEDLARLALPDPRDIETTRRDQEDRLQRQKSAKENVAKAAAEIAALERKLANLSGKGVVATPSDLAAARTARDKALDKLQATPADETASREAAFAAVREAVLRLDMVTDSLLGDADRAAAIQALEQDLTEAREAEQAEREKQQDLLAESKAAQEAWVRLWEPSGIEPATPDAMREWLRRVTDILEQLERLGAIRASIAELESRLAGRKPALLELLERLGGRNARSLPAEDIHAEAHRLVAAMQKQWNERRGHAALLKQAGEDIARIEAEIATLDAEARDLSTQWAADMADICRGPETGEAEAEAALESWANASAHRPKREDLLHRIEAMQRD